MSPSEDHEVCSIPFVNPQTVFTLCTQAFLLALDPRLQNPDMIPLQPIPESECKPYFILCIFFSDYFTPALFSTPTRPETMAETEDTTPGDEPDSPVSSKTPRATVKNPIFGLVEGTKRGNVRSSKWHLAG
jgi:hypothetical protein